MNAALVRFHAREKRNIKEAPNPKL